MTDTRLHITICQKKHTPDLSLQLLDILLDETLLYGTIYIPTACFERVSTLNGRLPCKQVYELVLRLAAEYPVVLTDMLPTDEDGCMVLVSEPEPLCMDSLKADAYIISRYKQLLQEQQLFDAAVTSLLEAARSVG